jgi:hypothetical protein
MIINVPIDYLFKYLDTFPLWFRIIYFIVIILSLAYFIKKRR